MKIKTTLASALFGSVLVLGVWGGLKVESTNGSSDKYLSDVPRCANIATTNIIQALEMKDFSSNYVFLSSEGRITKDNFQENTDKLFSHFESVEMDIVTEKDKEFQNIYNEWKGYILEIVEYTMMYTETSNLDYLNDVRRSSEMAQELSQRFSGAYRSC